MAMKTVSIRLNNTDTNEVEVKYFTIISYDSKFDDSQWELFKNIIDNYFNADAKAIKIREEHGCNITNAIEFACNEIGYQYKPISVDAQFDFNC